MVTVRKVKQRVGEREREGGRVIDGGDCIFSSSACHVGVLKNGLSSDKQTNT